MGKGFDGGVRPGAGERHRDNVLQSIGANLEGWSVQVKREKAVYHTLNKCRCGHMHWHLSLRSWDLL